ncbi:MAG TPA: hypothetical protein VH741_06935, partial [Candidatus Limnocylindrales bacterium]
MAGIPTWVGKLQGGRRCAVDRIAAWDGWTDRVTCYSASFKSPYPKRNRAEWKEHWPIEYGKPPLISGFDGGPSIGEREVALAFIAAGWDAVWTDTFGSAPEWMRSWKERVPPVRIRQLIERLRYAVP